MVAELIYSEEGLRNRAIFIKNDINIYIEDTGKEYLYEEVFKRLFNGKYKINAIFSLGGKINVLKEFIRKGNKDSKGNPNIFLLDGDFDKYIGYPEVCRKDFTYDVNNEQKLDEFLNYVAYHFNYEESILRRSKFSGTKEHFAAHKLIFADALRLKEAYLSGKLKPSAFFAFIFDDFIVGHMLKEDIKFFPFVHDNN